MTFVFPIETSKQRAIVACGIVFSLLAVAVVGLRVLARRKANRLLDMSDYLIIASCFFTVIYQGVAIASVLAGGVGYHVEEIRTRFGVEAGPTVFLQQQVVIQILWAISLGLCRFSILNLSTKIFVVQSFVVIARATYALVVVWAITATLSAFLMCRPFAYTWDKTIEGGKCGDPMISWVVTGVLNMVSDLIILTLPMPYLFRLEMPLVKRLILIAVFGILVLPTIVSITRIAAMSTIDFDDITWTVPHTILLSALEPCLAVTLGCVIILRPLFGGRYTSDGTATFNTPPVDPLSRKNSNRRFRPLNDDSSETRLRPEDVGYQASVAKSPEPFRGFDNVVRDKNLEMGLISIKHEWTVEEEIREELRPPTSSTHQAKSEGS
ncbi:hypothetical protein GGS26DRAFT_588837 [Hypomontagnella submonticulosa]|nr:hypothetical protein GGS26DRAFT_588837 [Hypomontagnella submonticulosa]